MSAPVVSPRTPLWQRLPVVRDVRRAVGWQRAMLIGGLIITAAIVIAALFAPWIAPYGPSQLAADGESFGSTTEPSAAHPFGTTVGGYDVLSRVLWGARTAALVMLLAVAFSLVIGVLLGLIAGYFGGWLDRVLVVVADAVYAFPSLLLAIVVSIMVSGGRSDMMGGITAAAASITVVFIPQYLRVVRAEVVRVKAEAFVESAKVIGASTPRIMVQHVLRNSTRTLPLIMTLNASEAVLTLAGLGFIGFGIEPSSAAEWGYDLNRSIADVSSGIWWTALFPGIAIVLSVLGLTLVGESLNDLADPRLRVRKRAGKGAVVPTSVDTSSKVEEAR